MLGYGVIVVKNRKYNSVRYYKKFKRDYLYFVLFIKDGSYYYTYDMDAKIMMYLYNDFDIDLRYRVYKEDFKDVLFKLHESGLNVVLAGWKKSQEFYTFKSNEYLKVKKKAKEYYKTLYKSSLGISYE